MQQEQNKHMKLRIPSNMGIADIGDKLSEFRGIKHLLKGSSSARGHHESVEGQNERGIAGGPQRARGRGGGSSRAWMKLEDDGTGGHRALYAVRGAQVCLALHYGSGYRYIRRDCTDPMSWRNPCTVLYP